MALLNLFKRPEKHTGKFQYYGTACAGDYQDELKKAYKAKKRSVKLQPSKYEGKKTYNVICNNMIIGCLDAEVSKMIDSNLDSITSLDVEIEEFTAYGRTTMYDFDLKVYQD